MKYTYNIKLLKKHGIEVYYVELVHGTTYVDHATFFSKEAAVTWAHRTHYNLTKGGK